MKADKPLILVVDDEAFIRIMLVDLLEDAGMDVVEAGTVDEALQVLEQASGVRVVLTDIEMPGALNGVDLARLTRERWPHIELLVMSGRTFPQASALPTGVEFWAKPYSTDRLLSRVLSLTGDAA